MIRVVFHDTFVNLVQYLCPLEPLLAEQMSTGGFSTRFLHFFVSQDDNLTGKFGMTSEMTARLRERKILYYYFFPVNSITKINRELSHCL